MSIPNGHLHSVRRESANNSRLNSCGETLKNGSAAVLSKIQDGKLSSTNVGDAMVAISEAVEEQMGGTSGGLFSIFFNALAGAFYQSESKTASSAVWAKCLESALNQLYNYTRARPPSRTLVDPLGACKLFAHLDEKSYLNDSRSYCHVWTRFERF